MKSEFRKFEIGEIVLHLEDNPDLFSICEVINFGGNEGSGFNYIVVKKIENNLAFYTSYFYLSKLNNLDKELIYLLYNK